MTISAKVLFSPGSAVQRIPLPAAVRIIVVMLSLLFPIGCAPTQKPPGQAVVEPRLEQTAIITADDARLPLRRWLPDPDMPLKAVVIALHGMNDYANAFDGAGRFLAARGIGVYAYDQRGFGQSPWPGYWAGQQAMADDLILAVHLIGQAHPHVRLYVLGESMGGAVAMVAMTGANPPPVAGVILSAPAVWGRHDMSWLEQGALWFCSHSLPWMTLTGEGLDVTPSDNVEMLQALGRDPLVIKHTRVDAINGLVDLMSAARDRADRLTQPVLMLYGEKDQVIPADPTFRTMLRLPKPESQRKALYRNGYHMLMRDLQADVVLGDIAAWIQDPTAALPSSADEWAEHRLSTLLP